MASVIDTTRPEAGAGAPSQTETARERASLVQRTRGLFRSRITRLIFVCNFIGLFVLLIGALLLSETRTRLTQAQYQALQRQGELIANILVASATLPGDPEPVVLEADARNVLHQLVLAEQARRGGGDDAPRVRLFGADGRIIADTDVLAGIVDQSELAPLEERAGVQGSIRAVERATRNIETLRLTPWRATISLEDARREALRGQAGKGQMLNERGERVVLVSVPLRRVQAVLGFVTLESADVERILLAERLGLLPFVIAAALVTCLASTLLALFIANPLRKLAYAADRLRVTGATRLRLPEATNRKDEIGDLALSLEQMTEALADRIDLNERFAADVSHEIKNPLASIRSAVDTVRAIKDPDQQARLLAIIAQDANRLDRLITDIARATRIDAETARAEFERVDLERLAGDLARAYNDGAADQGGVRVLFEGSGEGEAVVRGQTGPLGQVFSNLIDNARSFSPADGAVRVKVSIERRREGAFARAAVEDEGPGIPGENLETIFERFYTERPKGAAFGGNSGLGLSIARGIVEQHRGRIWAENISGPSGRPCGARLVVELPVAGSARPHF
ncbi:MAG: ATP-binding protein [Hyphomonadaceae bacterium]